MIDSYLSLSGRLPFESNRVIFRIHFKWRDRIGQIAGAFLLAHKDLNWFSGANSWRLSPYSYRQHNPRRRCYPAQSDCHTSLGSGRGSIITSLYEHIKHIPSSLCSRKRCSVPAEYTSWACWTHRSIGTVGGRLLQFVSFSSFFFGRISSATARWQHTLTSNNAEKRPIVFDFTDRIYRTKSLDYLVWHPSLVLFQSKQTGSVV